MKYEEFDKLSFDERVKFFQECDNAELEIKEMIEDFIQTHAADHLKLKMLHKQSQIHSKLKKIKDPKVRMEMMAGLLYDGLIEFNGVLNGIRK